MLEYLSNPLISMPISFFVSVLAAAFYDALKKYNDSGRNGEKNISKLEFEIERIRFMNRQISSNTIYVYFGSMYLNLFFNSFFTIIFGIMAIVVVVLPQDLDVLLYGISRSAYEFQRQWFLVVCNGFFGIGTAMTALRTVRIKRAYVTFFNPAYAVAQLKKRLEKAARHMDDEKLAYFTKKVEEVSRETYGVRHWIVDEGPAVV